jgi:peroxiredoxin
MDQTLLVVIVILLGLILLSLWLVLYQLVKQQGRMLLHLDDVERRLANAGHGVITSGVQIERTPTGLDVGTPLESFSLPHLMGQTVSLEDFRGKRVLLVNWSPHCGFCDQLAPDLVRLHREHSENGLALIMVGRGEPEENRRKAEQHGFEFPVVLQDRWKLSRQYGIFATPAGFLINEEGVIAKDVGKGSGEILALAQEGLNARKAV